MRPARGLALLLALLLPQSGWTLDDQREARLKAGFLANFVQFVTWPAAPSRIGVCGLGAARSGDTLDQLVRMAAQQPAFAVRRLRSLDEADSCQVLYLEGDQGSRLPGALTAVNGRPVLVVTDFEAGVPLGATLSLVGTGGGRLGFDVNLTAARAAGLGINTRLLQLARRVY